VAGDIGHREAGLYTLKLNAVRVDALVGTGPRALHGNHDIRVALRPRCKAELNVSVPYNTVWAPVFELIRKYIGIHERAPVLTSAESPQFAPCMTQPESRLSGIHSGAEELELKDRLEFAHARWDVTRKS